MSDRQRRISGLAFVVGVLAGLVLVGAGGAVRAAGAERGAVPPSCWLAPRLLNPRS